MSDNEKKTTKSKNMYSQEDLDAILAGNTETARVVCELLRPCACGIRADREGIGAFVTHHLKIAEDAEEFELTVNRILNDEFNSDGEEGELEKKITYCVKSFRRSEHGPFILEHQVKALLKQAASRSGIYKKKIGSKGDVAEMGLVRADGESLQRHPWEVYFFNNPKTEFRKISGSVNSPKGTVSIQNDVELVLEGAQFSFSFNWPPKKLSKSMIPEIIATMTRIKLGSCLSLGFGEFKVLSLELD